MVEKGTFYLSLKSRMSPFIPKAVSAARFGTDGQELINVSDHGNGSPLAGLAISHRTHHSLFFAQGRAVANFLRVCARIIPVSCQRIYPSERRLP
jgi:hypothetical protein